MYIFNSYILFLNNTISKNEKYYLTDNGILNNSLTFCFFKHGISKKYSLDLNFFISKEYELIKTLNKKLKDLYNENEYLIYNKNKYYLYEFDNLINVSKKYILSQYTIQRYKGLGEMSAEQLWDTTMNPKTRILYRLCINDINKANSIFSHLMGDNIYERKKMIENHTYSLYDLDF